MRVRYKRDVYSVPEIERCRLIDKSSNNIYAERRFSRAEEKKWLCAFHAKSSAPSTEPLHVGGTGTDARERKTTRARLEC